MTLHLARTAIAAALGLCAAVVSTGAAKAATIRVSQESAAGAGDFDANILGEIDAYDVADGATPLSLAAFYRYGGPTADGYNGAMNGGPDARSDVTQLFFVAATDGLHFVTLHDSPDDESGGMAQMTWTLTGGAGGATGFTLFDDVGDAMAVSDVGADRVFDTTHMWWACCSDGFGIGALPDAFTLLGGFDKSPTGISRLHAADPAGGVALVLAAGRRTRFELAPVSASIPPPVLSTPIPATLPLAGAALVALAALGRRRRARG